MKNNNFNKILLALALASAAFVPSMEKSYAVESSELADYDRVYIEFNNTLTKAKEVKNSYKYINASYYYQRGLNSAIDEAELVKKNVRRYDVNSSSKISMATATTELKFSMEQLNGEKASTADLKALIDANSEFIKSSAYLFATEKQKEAYLDSYQKAYRFYVLYGEDNANVSADKVNSYKKDLEEKKAIITNAYAPYENKQLLREEITLASPLRNDADKYTKKSFDSFMSALRLAETSVEDKSNIKTAAEYKEIAETLKAARLALVKVEVKDERLERNIARLKEAVNRNKVAVKSAEFLLESAPKQVAPVKDKLLKLLADAKETIEKSEAYLDKIRNIKG